MRLIANIVEEYILKQFLNFWHNNENYKYT